MYEEVDDNAQQHGENRRAMESDHFIILTNKTVAVLFVNCGLLFRTLV